MSFVLEMHFSKAPGAGVLTLPNLCVALENEMKTHGEGANNISFVGHQIHGEIIRIDAILKSTEVHAITDLITAMKELCAHDLTLAEMGATLLCVFSAETNELLYDWHSGLHNCSSCAL